MKINPIFILCFHCIPVWFCHCRCVRCEMTFDTLSELRKHNAVKHPPEAEMHECPICEKQFTKSYIGDHVRSHKHANECGTCQKNFSSRSNLRKHERKHNPDYQPSKRNKDATKGCKCDACGKTFIELHSLKVTTNNHLHTTASIYHY